MSRAQDIKQKALELGFDLVGITDASTLNTEQVELLADWLANGFAGQMGYMHNNFEKRINPAKLLENARTVICVGLNYTPRRQSHPRQASEPAGKVANYAQYEDYHSFIKKRLWKLADFLGTLAGTDFKFKICVDSVPLAERALAARAGLGFIGKNHMLINPEFGSQTLLGEIITEVKLEPDEPLCRNSVHKNAGLQSKDSTAERSEESIQSVTANCADCNKCIAACPTGALRADGQFDANKCIGYLTIEYKDQIPLNLAEKIGAWLFGCDECVLACPYQQNGTACENKQFKFYDDRARLSLQEVLSLNEELFEAKFADSVIKRLGLERLKRNAQICLANITHGKKA